MRNRPIALGVNGLADVFAMLKMPFDSEEARKLNSEIFETIYFASLTESHALAKEKGKYETFSTSPAAKGTLQFDFVLEEGRKVHFSGLWKWDDLKESIKKDGLRNSLTVALMPTASSSGMYGYNESFEPYTNNLYLRRTLSGEYIMTNQHLVKDLIDLEIWNDDLKNKLMANNGSVQDIDEIPDNLKLLYRTVWEIPQKNIIEMSADRGAFIDQSQSLNIHMTDANVSKVSSMHFYGWKQGLKTGMYYLRTQAARDAIKFTVKKSTVDGNSTEDMEREKYGGYTKKEMLLKIEENKNSGEEDCESCSV
jgi:ribonucleotide reductase alpha subunit